MDKNTLSNYGWIVIAVLVLSVMIALATPFGAFIEQGVRSTTEGLFNTSKSAVNSAFEDLGVQMDDQTFEEGYQTPNDKEPTPNTLVAGLYQDGSIKNYKNGQNIDNAIIKTWDNLVKDGDISIIDGELSVINPDVFVGDVIFDNSVKSIKDEAFYYNRNITGVYFKEGNSLEKMGKWAFGDAGLKIADMSNTTLTNLNSAFMWCYFLKEIELPETLTTVGYQEFASTVIETIDLPDGVTSIGMQAFDECIALKSIKLPSKVVTINNNAFYGCKKLESVTIPNSVKYILKNAFNYCPKLEAINYDGSVEEWEAIEKFNPWYSSSLKTIICTDETITL